MKKHTYFNWLYFMLLLVGLFFSETMFSQGDSINCNSLIKLVEQEKICGYGTFKKQGSFTLKSKIISKPGGKFDLTLENFRDKNTGQPVGMGRVKIADTHINLSDGIKKEIFFTVNGITMAGEYLSEIVFKHENVSCEPVRIPIEIILNSSDNVVVGSEYKKIKIDLARPGWFNSILPGSFNKNEISFFIENKSDYPVRIKSFDFYLVDKNKQTRIDSSTLKLNHTNEIISSNSLKSFSMHLDRNDFCPIAYAGELRIFLENYSSPLKVSLELNVRNNATWAIITLLFGVLISGMVFFVDKHKPKFDLLEKLINLEKFGENFKMPRLQNWYTDTNLEIKEMISLMESKGEETEVSNKIDLFKKKILSLKIVERERERLTKNNNGNSTKQSELALEIKEVINLCLDGKLKESKKKLEEVKANYKTDTQEIGASDGESMLRINNDNVNENFEEHRDSFFQNVWKNRVAIFYPSFSAVVFILFLLIVVFIGFNEVYLSGSSTFGSNGLMDYAKIFFWGVMSNVFSNTLFSGRLKALKPKLN